MACPLFVTGHPTLGSAQVVRTLFEAGDAFQLEMKAGLIPVRFEDGRWALNANALAWRPMQATPAELAASTCPKMPSPGR